MSASTMEYTLSETILLAAQQLEEQGQSPFSAEDLIVQSWRLSPRGFGLKGYAEQFPDSNRVLASIMGERGLARRGWLTKQGQKLYALSKEGARVVKRIVSGEPAADEASRKSAKAKAAPPPPAGLRLPKDHERVFVSLLESNAMDKFTQNKAYELSFTDACKFWGITDHEGAEAIDSRMAAVESTLRQAQNLAAKGEIAAGVHEVTSTDVELLCEAHDQLKERFARHLTLLRARAK